MDDDDYEDDEYERSRSASPVKPGSRAQQPSKIAEAGENELGMIEELQGANEDLKARLREVEDRADAAEREAAKVVDMKSIIDGLKAQLKTSKENEGAVKERDKLR